MAVITTADMRADSDVRSAFGSVGMTAVNTDVVPSDVVHLGTSPSSDAILMLVRVANFTNAEAGRAYKNATFPVYHFARLTPSPVCPSRV